MASGSTSWQWYRWFDTTKFHDMVPVEKNDYSCAALCKYTRRRYVSCFVKTPHLWCVQHCTLGVFQTRTRSCWMWALDPGWCSKVRFLGADSSLCVSQSLMSFLSTSLTSEVSLFYWNMNILIGTDPLGAQHWEKLGGWGMLHEERTIFLTLIIQTIVNALAKHQCHAAAGQDIEGRWVRNALRNRVASFICVVFCRVLGYFHPKMLQNLATRILCSGWLLWHVGAGQLVTGISCNRTSVITLHALLPSGKSCLRGTCSDGATLSSQGYPPGPEKNCVEARF